MSTAGVETLIDSSSLTPLPQWIDGGGNEHRVQFYQEDSFLIDSLSRFLGAALAGGDSALVIATEAHRDALGVRLRGNGLDLARAIQEGRFLVVDAAETLAKFMVDGQLDAARFDEVVGGLIGEVAGAVQGEERPVAAFGEIVALLWQQGRREAAIRLEQLWNRLAATHSFHLHCAYPMSLFAAEGDGVGVQQICAEHSHLMPAEGYAALRDDQQRLRAVVLLQQKAEALETEIIERRKAEEGLFRLAAIVASSDDAIVSKDLNGIITSWNESATRTFGYRAEEIIGRPVTLLIPPELLGDESLILAKIRAGERIDHFETVRQHKNGQRIDVSLTISPIRDARGVVIGASKILRDITEQKKTNDLRDRLAAIVDSSDDAIVSKDLNGVVTSWNKSAERIFGYREKEIVGRSITLLIPSELQEEESQILAKIRAGERVDHFQTVRLGKEGERVEVSLTISPIRNQAGKIVGAAKIIRDITQQKKLEAALHTTERLASVGRLAATVAHEINNPLEAVTNFVYLAKLQPDVSEETRSYLTAADRELARVAHIARQTLGFYRDTSRPVLLSVETVIDEVLAVYELKSRYKGLRIERRIEADLTVYALQGELKQVLSNLIANAIDASSEGGRIIIAARVSQHLPSGGRGVRITVADNGAGIAERDKARLFVPFFTTKKAVGTGLGLWITRDLLAKRGGHIQFRSSSDSGCSGTVMSVYLPEVELAAEAAPGRMDPVESTAGPSTAALTIAL